MESLLLEIWGASRHPHVDRGQLSAVGGRTVVTVKKALVCETVLLLLFLQPLL